MMKKKLLSELEAVAWRIERYLEEVEVGLKEPWYYKYLGKFKPVNTIYLQQRAKLTAYLYFLTALKSKLPRKIQRRRGTKIMDKVQGLVVDTVPYQRKLIGLALKQKLKKIRRAMPVPGWGNE